MPTVFKGGEAIRLKMTQISRELFKKEEGIMGVLGMGQVGLGPMDQKMYGGCQVEARTSEVEQALEELRGAVQRYDGLVGKLSGRLHSVLRPAPPAVCEGMPQPCYQTQLANEISGLRCLARDITDALESIIERIEV